jgi:hypothetical protein
MEVVNWLITFYNDLNTFLFQINFCLKQVHTLKQKNTAWCMSYASIYLRFIFKFRISFITCTLHCNRMVHILSFLSFFCCFFLFPWNWWVFGFRPSSIIIKTTEHNVSTTGSVSVLRWGGRHLHCWLPQKQLTSPGDGNRSSFWNTAFSSFLEYQMMDKVQKPSYSECYTTSSEPFRIYFFFSYFSFFFRSPLKYSTYAFGHGWA